jgi:hypothetical protein
MSDLLPPDIISQLRSRFGVRFDQLEPDQRLILATAASEGIVTHGRMNAVCDQHPVDLTRMLQGLVVDRFLIQTGRGRGTSYHLVGSKPLSPDSVFGPAKPQKTGALGGELEPLGGELEPLGGEFEPLGGELTPLGGELKPLGGELRGQEKIGGRGRIVDGLKYPLIDDLEVLSPEYASSLRAIAIYPNLVQRVPPAIMSYTIAKICERRYVTLKILAELLGREEKYLRDRIINPMIERSEISRAFPHAPNDPRQAYSSEGHLLEGK